MGIIPGKDRFVMAASARARRWRRHTSPWTGRSRSRWAWPFRMVTAVEAPDSTDSVRAAAVAGATSELLHSAM